MAEHYSDHYYLGRPIPEVTEFLAHRLRSDQTAALSYITKLGNPHVVSVGAGRGELEASLVLAGVRVLGIEPSEAGARLYRQTMREWAGVRRKCIRARLGEAVNELPKSYNVVLFCESIEHIPADEFWTAWNEHLRPTLERNRGHLVVVNWVGQHPTEPDHTGWDHVSLIDDEFYATLSEGGRIVHREGSHLVVRYGV